MSARFSELLVKAGLVTEAQLASATSHFPDVRVGSALILMGTVSPELINRALARHHGLPAIALSDLENADPAARAAIPAALARRHRAIGVAITGSGTRPGRTLLVAMRDPGDLPAVDEMAFATGMKLDVRIVPEIYLRVALERNAAADSAGDAAPPAPAPSPAASAAPGDAERGDRMRSPSVRPPRTSAALPSVLPVGPDPYAPSVLGRSVGLAAKLALLAALVVAGLYGYRTCIAGNTSAVGTHYAAKSLGLSIDFPDIGWRIAPAIGKKVATARAEYFYRGNAPEFPIVGMLLVRSTNSQAAAAGAAEMLMSTIIHNPKLRGCEGSDARPGAIMCVTTGTLNLFGVVKGVIATVEVHAWSMGSDVILAGMIQPDKTTTETKQILESIVER